MVLAASMFLLAAPSAQAAIQEPVLTGTSPVSPGASLQPRVMGEVEEGGETARGWLGRIGPMTRLVEPDNPVRLYTDPACTVFVGEGDVEELKNGGIEVNAPVAQDDVTTFYAKHFDPVLDEESECSAPGLDYRQVTTPPEAPVFGSVDPPSPADQNSPRLIGIADPEANVTIYEDSGCAGSAISFGSGAQFGGAGIQVSVPDNSETNFWAKATITVHFVGGGTADFASGCSAAPISYQEVTPPPDPGGGGGGGNPGGDGGVSPGKPVSPPPAPRLRTVPGGWGNDNTPVVTGSAPGASTVRIYADPRCGGNPIAKVSAGEFEAGVPMRVVDNDVTVLSAVGDNGKSSPCSEPVVYVEDSLTPRTRITMAPGGKTAKRKAIFRFMDTTGNAPGTTFLCRVDGRKWKQCTSPLRLRNLKLKRYVVQVKATDPAGNVETRGAKRSFKVIARP